MVQTSLTTWLQKPAAVLRPPPPPQPSLLSTSLPDAKASSTLARDATSAYTPALLASHQNRHAPTPASPSAPHASHKQTTPFGSFSLPPLPPNVELVPLTKDLLPSFKRLNSSMLPIAYSSSFYAETLDDPVIASLTLVALWHVTPPPSESSTTSSFVDPTAVTATPSTSPTSAASANSTTDNSHKPQVIGAIRCRPLPSNMLYISTLSLLPPYRSYGIATHLLHRILITAVEKFQMKGVMAHVWEANEVGLEWYAKRGFKEEGREEGYYRKLRPTSAVLMRRGVGVGDLLGR